MPTKKQFTIFIIFLIAALLSTWLFLTTSATKIIKNNPQNPDSFMTEVKAVQMNIFGKPNSILTTPKLVHYVQDNITDINNPFIIHYPEDEPPWHISANYGKMIQGAQKIILTDNVKAYQLPGKNSHNATLTTSKMIYYPKKNFAETDQPAIMSQPGSTVHSIGLQADLNKGEIKLLSNVSGEYDKALETSESNK